MVSATCQLDTEIWARHRQAMNQVSVADLKANFSGWLDAVRQGERRWTLSSNHWPPRMQPRTIG